MTHKRKLENNTYKLMQLLHHNCSSLDHVMTGNKETE